LNGKNTATNLILYTTSGCHLCELAEEILYAQNLRFTPVDIADDIELIQRYGVKIPVIADQQGRELGWPFDGTGLSAWLGCS